MPSHIFSATYVVSINALSYGSMFFIFLSLKLYIDRPLFIKLNIMFTVSFLMFRKGVSRRLFRQYLHRFIIRANLSRTSSPFLTAIRRKIKKTKTTFPANKAEVRIYEPPCSYVTYIIIVFGIKHSSITLTSEHYVSCLICPCAVRVREK